MLIATTLKIKMKYLPTEILHRVEVSTLYRTLYWRSKNSNFITYKAIYSENYYTYPFILLVFFLFNFYIYLHSPTILLSKFKEKIMRINNIMSFYWDF